MLVLIFKVKTKEFSNLLALKARDSSILAKIFNRSLLNETKVLYVWWMTPDQKVRSVFLSSFCNVVRSRERSSDRLSTEDGERVKEASLFQFLVYLYQFQMFLLCNLLIIARLSEGSSFLSPHRYHWCNHPGQQHVLNALAILLPRTTPLMIKVLINIDRIRKEDLKAYANSTCAKPYYSFN